MLQLFVTLADMLDDMRVDNRVERPVVERQRRAIDQTKIEIYVARKAVLAIDRRHPCAQRLQARRVAAVARADIEQIAALERDTPR